MIGIFFLRATKRLFGILICPTTLFLLLQQAQAQPFKLDALSTPLITGNYSDTFDFSKNYRQALDLLEQDLDSALTLLYPILNKCIQSGNSYGRAQCIISISYAHFGKGDIQRALQFINKEEPFILGLNSPGLTTELYLKKGIYNRSQGFMDTAIQYYYKALRVVQQAERGDSTAFYQYKLYAELGAAFMTHKADIPAAIRYFKQAEAIALSENNRAWLGDVYSGLGGAYANENLADLSIKSGFHRGLTYLHKAVLLSSEARDFRNLKNAYNNLAAIHTNLLQKDSAEFYVQKSMQLGGHFRQKSSDIRSLFALGALFAKQKKYDKAIPYLEMARTYCIETNAKKDLLEIDKTLYLVFLYKKDFTRSLAYLQAYTLLHDSLMDTEKMQAIANLEIKYRTAEKDKELALKNGRLGRQQSQLREKNLWIGAGGLSTLLLIGLLLVWRRNSQHRRQWQEEQLRLIEKEQEVYKQNEEIRSLNAMVKGEERERARLGRELHDGIVSQLAAVKMNLDTLQLKYPVPEDEHRNVLHHLEDIVSDLRKTAHNLVPGLLLELGLLPALESYCEKTAYFTGLDINFVHQGHIPLIHTDFELSLYRMVQELVQNVIKHAQASHVLVQVDYHEPMLIITVEDDGKGIDTDATAGDTGIGLSNIRSRINALKGSMDIKGRKNKGTSVYLEFDLSFIQSLTDV